MFRFLFIWLMLGGLAAGACAEEPRHAIAVLSRGADPSVAVHAGGFVMVQANRGALELRQATNLAGLREAVPEVVWPAQCCGVWAPELSHLRGRWWIHYARDQGRNEQHRMYALESVGDDPRGPYRDRGKVGDASADLWAIDGAPFEFNARLYFVWSGWPTNHDGQQNLYIAPMSDPATLSGPRVLLAEPRLDWERRGLPLMEGPQPIVHGGRLFVLYSASGSWTDDYCLGLMSFRGGDPLEPSSWERAGKPVFSRTSEVFGPGHNCLVPDPRGGTWWNVYHAIDVAGGGWSKRSIRAQPFRWRADGTPDLGAPLPLPPSR